MAFAYAVISSADEVVGIVPTFVYDVPVAMGAAPKLRRLLRSLRARTLFVGSPTSVCGTIGLIPEIDLADVFPIIAAALDERAAAVRAQLVVWKDFPDEADPVFGSLHSDFRYVPLKEYPGTALSLAPTWDGYLKSLNGRRRFRLRKKLRLSHEAAALTTEIVESPDDATLTEIYALYRQTYEHAANTFEELAPSFFREIARAPEARFVILREPASGAAVAFMLTFVIGARGVNRFIGLDYRFVRPWNLHFRLWESAARYFQSVGVTDVHSGPTSYRFKIETGHELVPMTTYVKHANPLIQRAIAPFLAASVRATDWTSR